MMKPNTAEFDDPDPVGREAAVWTVRIGRGLTAGEQDQYSDWLAADPRHAEAMREYQWGWDELDRLAGLQPCAPARIDPDLLDPARELFRARRWRGWWKYLAAGLPVAALLVIGLFFSIPQLHTPQARVQPALELMTRIEQRILEDGTKVELNRMAAMEVAFTPAERRIRLFHGEANFEVTKDPQRPFIVSVNGIDVRAVGTVFSVKFVDSRVDVVVTEGRVAVPSAAPGSGGGQTFRETILEVGQLGRIDVEEAGPAVAVTDLSQAELEQLNLWRPLLLDYDNTPLREIVAEFNRRNPIQVVLAEPELGELHLSSSFWSDNVEGFVRLMASSFGMQAEWRSSREIVLRRQLEQPL